MTSVRKVRILDLGLKITDDLSKYKIKHPEGWEIVADGPEEHARAMEALNALAASIAPRTDYVRNVPSAGAPPVAMSLNQAIAESEVMEGSLLGGKTRYEYKQMQEKLAVWFATKRGRPNPPLHTITKQDISDYVKHLMLVEELTPNTIDGKYLPAIKKLFERARKANAFAAEGDLPTDGHRLMTTRQRRERRQKQKLDKPYTSAELQEIFALKTLAACRLFHKLTPDKFGFLGASYSKWWRRHAKALGITDRRKVFHSFRHLVTHVLRREEIEERVCKAIIGHEGGDVHSKYGSEDYPLPPKIRAIARLTYPGLVIPKVA